MAVRFHAHARERMAERGATEDEVRTTVEQGEQFPAKFGRTGFAATSCLTTNGAVDVIGLNRWRPTLFRKALTGWSSRFLHAIFEHLERRTDHEIHV